MNETVLRELAKKWRRQSELPDTRDGSDEAKVRNAVEDGISSGRQSCAHDLEMLLDLLGDRTNRLPQ